MSDWFTHDDVADVIAVITSAPSDKTLVEIVQAALRAVNPFEWRPIETAPKDGTEILVSVTYSLGDGEWETTQWVDYRLIDDSIEIVWPVFQDRINIPFPPSRWMPLPSPQEGK